jgi:hypothetical protein
MAPPKKETPADREKRIQLEILPTLVPRPLTSTTKEVTPSLGATLNVRKPKGSYRSTPPRP